MASEYSVIEYSEVLTSMAIYVAILNYCCMCAIELINIITIEPSHY